MKPNAHSPVGMRRAVVPRAALVLAGATLFVVPVVLYADDPEPPPLAGRIAYTRFAEEGLSPDIFTSDPNGDNETRVTDTDDVAVYGNPRGEDAPRWSPDGREIAFTTANKDGLVSIWRVPVAGGTPTAVVTADGDAGAPAWQPGGACIAYSGARTGPGPSKLDLKRWCTGGSVATLLDTDEIDEGSPDWSPDGEQIVYEARPAAENGTRADWSLRLVAHTGSGDRQLLSWPGLNLRYPRWSPDGTRIAFIAGSAYGFGTLHVMDVASQEARPLVSGAASPPAWSPDGTRIIFYNTYDSGPQQIKSDGGAGKEPIRAIGAGSASPPPIPQPLLPKGVKGSRKVAEFVTESSIRSGGQSSQHPEQVTQRLGLYMFDLEARSLMRLRGAAGGTSAPDRSFRWGYSPDWTAGTPTPTPSPTPVVTATPSPTPAVVWANYLPVAHRLWPEETPPEPGTPPAGGSGER